MHKQKMKKDYAKQLTVFVLVLALVLTSVFGLMTDMPKQAFAETNSSSEISTDGGNSQDVAGETNEENPQNVDESTNGGNSQDVSGESNEGGNSSSDKVSTFADDHDHSSWTPLTTAGGELEYGKYVLDKNVNLLNNITISDNVTLDLNGFKLNGVYGTPIITIADGGTFTLLDCNGSGGEHSYTIDATGKYKFDATHNPSSATKIEGGVITGGNATSGIKGGGVNNAGTFKMSGGTIAGNTCTASKGAGGVQNSGTFEMSGGTIAGNTCTSTLSAGGVYNAGTFTMTGGKISGNKGELGAGVNNDGTNVKPATFDMSGTAEIVENISNTHAGGVHNKYCTFTMSGGKIMKNKAGHNGGGVFNDGEGGKFTLTGGVISENIMNGAPFGARGGGVLADGTFNISGTPTITGNVKEVGGVKTPENVNVYKRDTIKVTGSLKTGDTFAKIAVTLFDGFGDGVFTSGYGEHNADTDPSKIFLMDDGKSVTLDANEVKVAPPHTHTDSIVFDKALTDGGTLTAGNYVLNDDIELNANLSIQEVTVNLCLNGHKLTGKAGGSVITTTTNAILNLYDCQENSSEHQHTYKKDATTGLYNFATGATGEEGTIKGGVITGGSGRSGGGFYNGGTLNIFAGTIAGNKSTEGGSGVYNAGTFNMYNGKIVGNTTTSEFGKGGGVYNFGTFSMTGGTIADNNAEIDGGGVFNNGTVFKISGTPTINNNKKGATSNNLFVNTGKTVTVTGDLKSGETYANIGVTLASDYGKGVFTSGYGANNAGVAPSKFFTMDNGDSAVLDGGEVRSVFKHDNGDHTGWNQLTGGTLQAGKYVLNENIQMTSNILVKGEVNLCLNGFKLTGKVGGSAITIDVGATLNLYDCDGSHSSHTYKVSTDDATKGLYVFGTGSEFDKTITGGVITGGTIAGAGVNNKGTFNMFAGTVAGNKTGMGGHGGGVNNNTGATFTMTGGNIVGNTAMGNGGGAVNSGAFTMTGGSIANNTAYEGGGVYNNNGTFEMNGGTISGNTAKNNGGGVYDYSTSGNFSMTGGTIADNNAEIDGGGVYASGTFKISGTPTINNNKKGATSNNLSVNTGKTVTVTGALKSGETFANIGVTLPSGYGKGAFTSGYGASNDGVAPSKIFKMDNGDAVALDTSKEVKSIPHTHDDKTEFDKTLPTVGGALASGNYVLKGDTTLDNNLTINTGSVVNLCLNGFKLTGKGNGSATVIDIRSGATLNLHDCNGSKSEHSYYIDATGKYGFDATHNPNSETKIKGGVITGGNYQYGGGIVVDGTFNMFGGSIAGNTSTGDGAGVYVNTARTFTMTSGSIEGNTAKEVGGGVYNKGIFNLSGDAVISNNRVTATDGYAYGGGVYNNGTLNVSGAPIIKNNKDHIEASNLYLAVRKTITVTGNLFVGNKNAEIYVTMQAGAELAQTYYFAGTQNSEPVDGVDTPIDPSRFFKPDSGSRLAMHNKVNNGVQFVYTEKVDLDANGGVLGTTTSVKAAAGVGMPTIDKDGLPTMANYIFTGFFDAKTGGTKYYYSDGTSAKVYASGIITLYAQWAFDTTIAQQIIDNVTGTLDNDITEESLKKGIEQYKDALPETKAIVDANPTAKENIDNGIELLKVIDLLKSKPYNYGQLEKWIATWKGLTDDQKDLANIIGIPLDLTFEDMNTAYIDHRDEVDTFVKDVNAFKITIDNKDYAVELQMRFEGMPSKTDFLNNGYSRQDFVPMNVLAKIDALNKSLENVTAVEDLIDAITTPVTDEAGANQFLDANEKLNELSKSEKELVSNKDKLADGKKAYDDYVKTLADDNKKANEVIRAIGKLTYGTSPDLGSNATDILAVQKKFDNLTDAQKELVTNKTTLDDFKTTLDNVYDGSTKLCDKIKSIDISKATRAELNTIVDAYNAIKNGATNAKDGQIIRSTVGDKLTQILNLIDKLEKAEILIGDIPTGAINTKEEKIEDAKIAQEKLSENEKKLLDGGLKDKLAQEYQELNDYLASLDQKTIIKEKAESVDVSVYGLVTKLNKDDVPGLDTATEITIYVDAKTSQGIMVDLPETLKKVASFDVKLMLKITDGDNTQVQPISGKSVLLKLPLGSKIDLASARIYHISGNGVRSLVEDVTFVNENGEYFAIFKTSSFSEFIVVDEKTTEEKPSGGGSTGGGTTIPKENIFWSGINTQLKLTNTDPIVVDNSAENYSIPKYILENQKATSKTLTIKFADGEITITKEMAGKVSYTQESYTFAELKALFAESPVVTPTPTPTPTPEPTTPEVETCNLWWLWILIALVVIGGGTTYYFVNKNKKKNKEENKKK